MTARATATATYLTALRMLARRELSEHQIRTRLLRRKFDPADIDDAIQRLRQERALDDARTARAIARTAANVRGHGRRRALRAVEAAGIDRAIAAEALRDAFAEVDDTALLAAAINRKLRGRTALEDRREQARLFRYLIGQGFEPDRVATALRPLLKRR